MTKIEIIGLMSGTSMDGLDISHVSFEMNKDKGDSFRLLHTHTYPLKKDIENQLKDLDSLSVSHVFQLDKAVGKFYADCVLDFIKKNKIDRADIAAIASHGQTILHQPQNGFTVQIGCGTTLAYHTGIKVINDFRTRDVVAGGQGAPLVPMGDFNLFSDQAEAFLNIGGITNVSFKQHGKIHAFDICPGNLPLNKLSSAKGLAYDKGGELARQGDIQFFLLDLLNSLEYYQMDGPKSLGTEWLEANFYPLLKFDKEIENNLRTVVEHIAFQIAQVLNRISASSVMITGGGAKNSFLVERIAHYFNGKIILPSAEVIDFKEAIIFAYLGALYLCGHSNTFASVTGASRDLIGGVLHIPG